MDGWHLALFLAATYFGGLTSGLSGFAMGLVVSGVWLHLVSPQQNALLIVLCGLVTQGSGIWRVRHAINWWTIAPYIIGGAVGIPAGIALVTTRRSGHDSLHHRRAAVGLQPLQPDPAGLQTAQGELSGGSWCRRHQWPDRRLDRAWRRCGDCLVPTARRKKGRAARGLSAGAVRNICHDDNLVRDCRHIYDRNTETLCVRPPGTRLQASGRVSRSTESSTMPRSVK